MYSVIPIPVIDNRVNAENIARINLKYAIALSIGVASEITMAHRIIIT